MANNYRLYGAEVSYYTGKARAYLRYKDIPFEEILATREVYKEVILPRVGWPVIPVVVTPDDVTLQDTTDIIDSLEARFPEPSVYPDTPRQRLAALLLETYGDEWLVIPAMHYRWNHCFDWIILEFGKLSAPDASEEEQRMIGTRNARNFHGALPPLGVHADTESAIEISYLGLLADLERHFSEVPFLFGTRPSIGDFGLIGPLYAHLYRDPYPGDLMRRTAPSVTRWVEGMQNPEPRAGEFRPDDEIPETLLPILRRMVDEQFPVLLDTLKKTAAWLNENPEEEIPRAIGRHDFTLLRDTDSEVTSQRSIRPFSQWMFQRAIDFYRSQDGANRDACDQLLAAIGAPGALDIQIERRVERENFRLVRGNPSGRGNP